VLAGLEPNLVTLSPSLNSRFRLPALFIGYYRVVYKRVFRIRQIVCCVTTLAILPVCAAAATSFSALRILVQFQADYSARETINPWWYVFVDGLLAAC
jgi:hypothetical protein